MIYILKENLHPKLKKHLLKELEEVYNRGFSSGFYFGKPGSEEYAGIHGSKATTKKEYRGKVINYFKKAKAVHVLLEAGEIKAGDSIYIIGTTTGVVELKLESFLKNDVEADSAQKGDEITFICENEIRPRDLVYLKKQTFL